jgi:uncharacterized protein
MTTETKALAPFELKAADAETRTFEGLASTWDMDLGADVIHKGAFSKTLKDWKASGRVVPLIDQHNYFSVRHVLGKLIDADERAEGLWTKWRVTEGQDGDELMHRLRGGIIDGLSIGYEVVKSEPETRDGVTVRHLKEINLREVSAVIWGMNPNAVVNTRSVKGLLDGVSGEDLSEDDRAELRRLNTRIGNLLKKHNDAPAPAADAVADEQVPEVPEATPVQAADSQTAEEQCEPVYPYPDALKQYLLRLRLQRVTP